MGSRKVCIGQSQQPRTRHVVERVRLTERRAGPVPKEIEPLLVATHLVAAGLANRAFLADEPRDLPDRDRGTAGLAECEIRDPESSHSSFGEYRAGICSRYLAEQRRWPPLPSICDALRGRRPGGSGHSQRRKPAILKRCPHRNRWGNIPLETRCLAASSGGIREENSSEVFG